MLLSNIYIFRMSNLPRSLLARLCLIALLLWGQAAVAVHEVDHSWHDATEFCQVFSSADNAKVTLIAFAAIDCYSIVEKLKPSAAFFAIENAVVKQNARGPPLHNLT